MLTIGGLSPLDDLRDLYIRLEGLRWGQTWFSVFRCYAGWRHSDFVFLSLSLSWRKFRTERYSIGSGFIDSIIARISLSRTVGSAVG